MIAIDIMTLCFCGRQFWSPRKTDLPYIHIEIIV